MQEPVRLVGVVVWAFALGCNAAGAPASMGAAGAGGGFASGVGGQPGSGGAGSMALPASGNAGVAGCTAPAQCGSGGAAGAESRMDAAPPGPSLEDASVAPDDASVVDGGTGGTGGTGDDDADRPGWTLTFREEFDEPAGTGVDESKWTPVNKGDGFGNNELQYYTGRTENVRTDGEGSLIIEVLEESYMGRDFTSARLESSVKFEQQYGRFEIRAKLPFGQGIWPAYWLLGNDIGSVSWPQCGEIDIMEHVGRMPSTNYGSLHGPGYSGGNPLSAQYHLEDDERFADAFHEYAVEWEPDVVRWYVDGDLYETRTPDDVPEGGTWVYDHPFFMILNVAVGGAFPGSPDDTTVFPQRLLVDYVRVYSR